MTNIMCIVRPVGMPIIIYDKHYIAPLSLTCDINKMLVEHKCVSRTLMTCVLQTNTNERVICEYTPIPDIHSLNYIPNGYTFYATHFELVDSELHNMTIKDTLIRITLPKLIVGDREYDYPCSLMQCDSTRGDLAHILEYKTKVIFHRIGDYIFAQPLQRVPDAPKKATLAPVKACIHEHRTMIPDIRVSTPKRVHAYINKRDRINMRTIKKLKSLVSYYQRIDEIECDETMDITYDY